MTLLSFTILLFGAAAASFAQTPAPPPSFEVASVKPAAAGSDRTMGCPSILYPGRSPGQFRCGGVTLRPLLRWAYGPASSQYGLASYQLEGPASLDSGTYDIEAKIPPGASSDDVHLMLQNLLVERFGLVVHWETREMRIYELVVAKGGSKLKTPEKPNVDSGAASPSDPGVAPKMVRNKDGLWEYPPGVRGMFVTRANGAQWLTARMESIADLLNSLEPMIGRPVVDKTGLTGVWDFNLRYSVLSRSNAGSAASADQPSTGLDAPADSAPNILGAFETQLGLKLESTKGPVKALVVDRVNRVPTEN